jgi:hypothetical protein
MQLALVAQQIVTGFPALGWHALTIHIFAGCLSLVFGFIATFTRKGGKRHRLSGKIGVALTLAMLLPAFVLLVLVDILPIAGHISYQQDVRDLLLLIFLGVTYSALQGYRWAVNDKPRIDSDLLWLAVASFISLFALFNVIDDLLIHPFYSDNLNLPMNPETAAILTIAISGIFAYFAIDDLRTFSSNKVSANERILKHTFRIMNAVGGMVTALSINNLGRIFVENDWNPLPVYIVPPTLFAALTMILAHRVKSQILSKSA